MITHNKLSKERKAMHSLYKAVAFINQHNKLNLKDEEIKNITKELIKAGFSEQVKKSQMPLIKTTVDHISRIRKRHNPLKVCASTHQQTCPLCATIAGPTHLTNIVLDNNRPAKYCAEHSVTLPVRDEK